MLTRRTFLQLTAMSAAAMQTGRAQSPSSVTVHTAGASLRGETVGSVHVFRGVPFAQPPVGPLRFRPPQPLQPAAGVRDATRFAPAAPQAGGSSPHSEDCLYLNVWAPKARGQYPVLVWVHGGGFTGGRSFDPLMDGTAFAQLGIIVVTVAYRLGVLGFLDVASMLGPSYAGSANNALRDLIAALTWVQHNIAAFGGDPARVTLGGQSAGAKLTDLLMGIPSATPLFHQMISESGGAERIATESAAEDVAHGFASTWTAETSAPPAAVLTAPVDLLITAQERFMREWPRHFPLRPELDPVFIPEMPLAAIEAGSTRGKRLLLGTNRDESALFIGPDPATDPSARDIGNMSVEQFRAIERQYAGLYPQMPAPLRRIRSLTAEEYLVPSIRVADAHVAAGNEAFVYQLDFPGAGRFAGLAVHSAELRFVWDHFEEAPSAAEEQLATSVHTAWAAFLKGGVPAGPGLPRWPPYTAKEQQTMVLNEPSHVEAHPDSGELALWHGPMR